MAESSTRSTVIEADLATVADIICDFPRYPEWTGALRETEVVARDPAGHPSRVRFVLDAGPLRDEYTLAYEFSPDRSRITWRLVAPSGVQRAQTGAYELVDNGDGTTTVTYTLEVELSIAMLGMFRRKAEKMIMETALTELKRRAESIAAERGQQ